MSILSRLFGPRKPEGAPPAEEQPPATEPPPTPAQSAANAEAGASAAAGAGLAAPGATSTAETPPHATELPPVRIPLRSLDHFRQDPAFRNFMDKAKRPPGAAPRRRSPLAPDDSERRT